MALSINRKNGMANQFPATQKKGSWLLTAAMIGALSGLPLFAEAQSCGPYQVAFYEFGSLYFRNDNGQFVGIDKDLIDELVRRTGCQLQGRLESRVRTWHLLENGDLDMTVSGVASPEREAYADFAMYVNSRNHLIVRRELAPRLQSMKDFTADTRLQLGVVKSFRHGVILDDWIDTLRKQGRVQEYADAEVVARVFAGGRVDAFLSQPLVWTPLLNRNNLTDQVSMLDLAPQENILGGLVFSRQRVAKQDIQKMSSAIEAMRRDGTLERIFSKYIGAAEAKKIVRLPHP